MKDWAKAVIGKPAACHYRCGMLATMTEPGTPWKAHKVCAERQETGVDQTSEVTPWDGDEAGSKAEPRALGCGDVTSKKSGRVCAGTGTQLSCRLCPHSPTYWNREGRAT